MPPPTYHIAVDLDDDGSFTGLAESFTSDVLHVAWRLGFSQPHDTVAAPIAARVTLRNHHRAYSPEHHPALQIGLPLRIQSHDGLTTRTHFTGFIHRVEPLTGEQGERLAVIHALGLDHQLGQHRIRLPPQIDVTADAVITALLAGLPLRHTPLKDHWLLGVPGHAELDSHTHLGSAFPVALQIGHSTLAYAADTWGDGIPALEAIRQMADAERGRFFVDRFGQMTFLNRHHTLLATTSLAAFSDDMDGLDYAYGADIANQVEVECRPRTIGASGSTLWQLANPQRIEPGELGHRRLITPYRDSTGQPMGALQVLAPVPFLDFTANTQPDGSGLDVTAGLLVILAESSFSGAVLEVRNLTAATAYLMPAARLRGTPLHLADPALVQHTDWASVNRHGLATLRLASPALTSADEADQMARYELARRSQPRGTVRALHLSGTLHQAQLLARTLFDRVTLHESQTAHTADYFIIAEEHEVDRAGTRHRARWLLEPAAASAFWILGLSLLDQTTVLAY